MDGPIVREREREIMLEAQTVLHRMLRVARVRAGR